MSRPKPPVTLPDTDDPYVLLDVRPGASSEQIRRAYLRRVKVFKPDRHPAEFRRVREAYDQLREQEAWFDAWRQANEVVRQAQQDAQHRAEGDARLDDSSGLVDGLGDGLDDGRDDGLDEPTDEALQAEAREQSKAEDDGEPSIERIVAELEVELRAEARERAEPVGRAETEPPLDPSPDSGSDPGSDSGLDPAAAPHRQPPQPTADERLVALARAVHEDLEALRYTDAAARLLGRSTLALAGLPEFSTLLLEACCALVWGAPALFDELVARYGDLIATQDTEYRDGALLHRRTLCDELAAWREELGDWSQLDRFTMLGASLRPPAEAELGLVLGKRAAAEPAAFLTVLARATARAPGIAALYVGMAERWAGQYGRCPTSAAPEPRPTVEQAADALAHTAQTHRWVRWEQLRPLLVTTVLSAIVVLTSSRVVELTTVGLMLVLWAWRAWAASVEERIYIRAVRPVAAGWLWATRASPDELAVAFEARLPRPGTWGAVLHPGDLSDYPHLLGNDLALLAFAVTAPMIPQLSGPDRGVSH